MITAEDTEFMLLSASKEKQHSDRENLEEQHRMQAAASDLFVLYAKVFRELSGR